MAESIDIITAIRHPDLINDTISPQQEVLLRVSYGLPLVGPVFRTMVWEHAERRFAFIEETPLSFYQRVSGRETYVPKEYSEVGLYLGARGGKSDKLSSNIAIYEGCIRSHKLSRGEKALVPVIAFDKKQAGIVYNYIKGKIQGSSVLSQMILNVKADEIELSTNLTIGVYPCSFRQMRGYSIAAAVADEIAVWRDEEIRANPAKEVIRALRRGMATFPNAKMVKISSPFAKTGVVWDDWSKRDEMPGSFIVKIPAWETNPILDPEWLLSELVRDAELFFREFGAEFWDSTSPMIPPEKVEAAVVKGRHEIEPNKDRRYFSVIDVAFRYDNFAHAICHRDMDKVVVDLCRVFEGSKKSPVDMEQALVEVVKTTKAYGQHKIRGDQFCAEPVRQSVLRHGLDFDEFVFTQNSKQALYANLRALFMSNRIEIPDDEDLVSELKTLEAVIGPAGSVKVQATAGYKDDRATVVALAAFLAMEEKSTAESWIEAFKVITSGDSKLRQGPGAEPQTGRTICVDCGKMMPFGENYYGVGAGMGQCMGCAAVGPPNFKAVLLAEVVVKLE